MLKYYNFDIVFQEIPDEVTLAINITHCPNHCPECHSKHLWADIGTPLTQEAVSQLIKAYKSAITCFCFMGGDREPQSVNHLAAFLRSQYSFLKIGWYSGRSQIAEEIDLSHFDYVKTGPFDASCGSLKKKTTNQRFYRVHPDHSLEDLTCLFQHSSFQDEGNAPLFSTTER